MTLRGNFDNSLKLTRFMLKREMTISAIWIVVIVLFSAGLAPGMAGMFDSDGRQQFVSTFSNPAMIAMMGPVYGADNYTAGAMYTGMMLLWILIAVAVMNIFLVSRHTRADEEKGRIEVIRSLPVGRLSVLNATMLTAVAVNIALGLLMGLSIAATGVESMGFAGSMLYGAVTCATGLVFAAITALFCQLSSNKSGATGYSFMLLGLFYMLRAVGDMRESEILSCISPLGLAQRSQPYIENNLWPVPLLLLICVLVFAGTYKLNAIRDLGQGFIHARPGRKEASVLLRNNFGLSFRLMRTSLIVWLIVMLLLGASYGSIIGEIDQFISGSPQYLGILGLDPSVAAATKDNIQKHFLTFITTMMTLICIIPLLIIAMKPRSEEKEHRAEHVLTRCVPRFRHIASYSVLAYAASVIFPCATAIGIYLSATTLSDNPFTLGVLMEANLAFIPALWVMIGAAVLLVGLLPGASGAIWGYFGFVFIITFMGELLGLPVWLRGLSPTYHISDVILGDAVNFTPPVILTAIAAILTAAGFMFYQKRDVKQ